MRKVVLAPSVAAVSLLGLLSASAGLATPAQAHDSARTSVRTDNFLPAPICYSSTTTVSKAPVEVCRPWKPMDAWTGRPFTVLTASFPISPQVPGVAAYAAWIRTSRTDLSLYPGYKGPGPTSGVDRGAEMVPLGARVGLLATFNSGFYEADGAGGFYTHHTLFFPMVKGLATVVRYTNGTIDIVSRSGAAHPASTVQMARQNLPLLVNASRATPLSADNSKWGLTLHGLAAVWRTAIGVDSRGNLLYVAAPNQTAASLAALMVRLHCVRAMELDINPEWPIFVTYAARGAVGPSLFVPNPNQIPNRFLYSSTKDFFAVFVSSHPGEAQPW